MVEGSIERPTLPPWRTKALSSLLSPSINCWLFVGAFLALLWGWMSASLLWPALYMVLLILSSV